MANVKKVDMKLKFLYDVYVPHIVEICVYTYESWSVLKMIEAENSSFFLLV